MLQKMLMYVIGFKNWGIRNRIWDTIRRNEISLMGQWEGIYWMINFFTASISIQIYLNVIPNYAHNVTKYGAC